MSNLTNEYPHESEEDFDILINDYPIKIHCAFEHGHLWSVRRYREVPRKSDGNIFYEGDMMKFLPKGAIDEIELLHIENLEDA